MPFYLIMENKKNLEEKFWANVLVSKIIKSGKKDNYIVACGVTPSGPIHLGGFREVTTAYVISESLLKENKKSEFIYIADDFDPLRKVYPFLPKSFEKYVGKPLSEIPDPWKCHKSYSDHFLDNFFKSLKEINITPKVYYASKLYKEGKYTPLIKEAIKNKDKIAKILETVTGRKLEENWVPFNPLCKKCGRLTSTEVSGFDLEKNKVFYKCNCGEEGEADFSKGEGKLPWRVDWPARWKMLNVSVEPMGKDHSAKGGSWDSGKIISEEIFKYKAPFPVFYEWLNLKGQGAMSSSKGIALEASEFLSITYPEILRYFLFRSLPQKHLDIDLENGFLNILEDFSKAEEGYHKYKEKSKTALIYKLSNLNPRNKVLSGIPFIHLVSTIQSSVGDKKEIKRILERSGFGKEVLDQKKLDKEIDFARNWLIKFAPEKYKFSIQKSLPKGAKELNPSQKELLSQLAKELGQKNLRGEEIHNLIYEIGKNLGLSPAESFMPIYVSLLGQKQGPKAGWFLSLLDKEFIIKRFKEASRN